MLIHHGYPNDIPCLMGIHEKLYFKILLVFLCVYVYLNTTENTIQNEPYFYVYTIICFELIKPLFRVLYYLKHLQTLIN